ncbi:MAG: hypothetical protein HFI48_14690 [Lachnospiraceae bacterium]|nr:hypothetical protein [Lachnospiraceae bacterium]
MKNQEQIDANLWWNVNIPQNGLYYYKTEHFEEVWKDGAVTGRAAG